MKNQSLFASLTLVGLLASCNQNGNQVPTTTLPAGTTREVFYVAPNTASCIGLFPTTCMLTKANLNDKWSFFYGGISGFNYQPGYRYKLSVLATKVVNPPADASNTNYALEKVIEKTADSSVAVVGQ